MRIIKSLFSSKKFVALVGAVVAYTASRFGLDVNQADADRIVVLAATYMGAQGLADVGKEAAKHRAADGPK